VICCAKCKRTYMVETIRAWPIHCRCGSKLQANGFTLTAPVRPAPVKLPTFPCSKRGQALETLDCGCDGDSTVYACKEFGACMIRKLKPGLGPDTTCNLCEVRDDPLNHMAIITTHFNPANAKRLAKTWETWVEQLNYPHICMELVLTPHTQEIFHSTTVYGGPNNCVWQKERLINLAIEKLPPSVRYVAWLDHDLLFDNAYWAEAATAMIDAGYDAVQLFDRISYLDKDGYSIQTTQGAASTLAEKRVPAYAPGGAWMASRQWLDSIGGVYDHNILGGGDAVFFSAITKVMNDFITRQPEGVRAHAQAWIDSVPVTKWGFVPGLARHIWHGDKKHRQYVSRDEILCRYDFDPAKHLRVGANGLLELHSAPDGLAPAILQYFLDRRDDG